MHQTTYDFPVFSRELLKMAREVRRRASPNELFKRVYFAHALTGVPQEILKEAEEIKSALESLKNGYERIDFYGLGEASGPEDIVEIDFQKAISADILVGLHVAPSYGAGGEVHVRSFLGLPTIFLAPSAKGLTRMMTGVGRWGEHAQFAVYENALHAAKLINDAAVK